MKRALYPQRTCREPMEGSDPLLTHNCELPDVHPGPCASYSIAESIQRRDAWEEAHPGWEQQIGSIDFIV